MKTIVKSLFKIALHSLKSIFIIYKVVPNKS
jgi:hypothetical protein